MITFAAPLTTASAPWWAVAALTGVITIVAGGLGGFISFWSLKKSDERHAGREELAYRRRLDERWDEDSRRLVHAFISGSRALMGAGDDLEKRLVRLYGTPPYPEPFTILRQAIRTNGVILLPVPTLPRKIGLHLAKKKLDKAIGATEAAVVEMILVAPDSIVKQSRRYLEAAKDFTASFSVMGDRTALRKDWDDESVALNRIVREEPRTRRDLDDPAF